MNKTLKTNEYYVATGFYLGRLYHFLKKNDTVNKATHIVFE
ncbi:hypothetical protein [uncultured Gammaproteobacteria bacterium]|nr:hypothetical protein [uncultured Gammaproteobacteria bacterium]CAC9565685.1 hypothetical protein [uncultured Gammaproteobacteria bacterium]CAC9587098.1 hypothetical protein [uncultured Gammaproteobacteria bacterium]CAC9981414.1 hypothetical protein [uncultured Gammaproteobacteria bacterium]